MGTSLTRHHAALLRRYAPRIVLAMDPDAAGLNATERAGGLVLGFATDEQAVATARSADAISTEVEIDLRVALLPAGRDPDELVRDDPAAWERATAQAQPFIEFLIFRMLGDARPASALEARHLVDRLRPVLLAVTHPIERGMYIQRVARHLGIGEDSILERLRQSRIARSAGPPRAERARPLTDEEVLLTLLLRHPGLRLAYRNYPESLFTGALEREVFRRWLRDPETAADPVDEAGQRAQALAGYRLPPLSEPEARRAADEKIRAILRDRIRLHQAARAEELSAAERELGSRRLAELAIAAWKGEVPPGPEREIAEALMEEFELGLSIHRRETPPTR
jgi:DNA primase